MLAQSRTLIGLSTLLVLGCSDTATPTNGAGGSPATNGGSTSAGGSTAATSGGTAGAAAGSTATSGGSAVGGSVGAGGNAASFGGSGAGGSPAAGSTAAGGSTATSGGNGSAGSTTFDPSAIIVSDNFDAAVANGWPDATKWLAYEEWARMQGIAPTIDSSKFRSAPNSARVKSSNVGLGSFLVPATGFPVAGNQFYVRVWMNWEKATSTIMGHSGFLVGATARDNSGVEVRLGISNKGPGDEAMMDLNLIGSAGGEVTRYSNGFTDGGDPGQFNGKGYQFPAGEWVCLEAFFNGATSEFRVWIGDTELPDMHVTDFKGSPNATPRTTWAPNYSVLKIGAQDYDANLGNIWYDDVIVAKSRVGCLAK